MRQQRRCLHRRNCGQKGRPSTTLNCYFYGGDVEKGIGAGGSGTNVAEVYRVSLDDDLDVSTTYEDDGLGENGFRIGEGDYKGYYCPSNKPVTLSFAQGMTLVNASYNDGSDHAITADNGVYGFAMPAADVTVSAIIILDPAHISVNDAGEECTIHTAAGWDAFCDLLAKNNKGFFDGKSVKLDADIGTIDNPVTRMAGDEYVTVAQGNSSSNMFDGCTSLVGGEGIAYDAGHTDGAYAHADRGADNQYGQESKQQCVRDLPNRVHVRIRFHPVQASTETSSTAERAARRAARTPTSSMRRGRSSRRARSTCWRKDELGCLSLDSCH